MDFHLRKRDYLLSGLVLRFIVFYNELGQHPIQSHICRSFISPTLARRRKYISKIEIALQMVYYRVMD